MRALGCSAALVIALAACGGDDDGGGGADAAVTSDGGGGADGGGTDGGGAIDAAPSADAAVPNLGAFRFTWTINGDAACASVGAAFVSVGITGLVGPSFFESYDCELGVAISDTYGLGGTYQLAPSLDGVKTVIATLPNIERNFTTCDDIMQAGGATLCLVDVPLVFDTGSL